MMNPERIQLLLAQVVMALVALMTHYIMHPPHHGMTYFCGTFFPAIDLVQVSMLFLLKKNCCLGSPVKQFSRFFWNHNDDGPHSGGRNQWLDKNRLLGHSSALANGIHVSKRDDGSR